MRFSYEGYSGHPSFDSRVSRLSVKTAPSRIWSHIAAALADRYFFLSRFVFLLFFFWGAGWLFCFWNHQERFVEVPGSPPPQPSLFYSGLVDDDIEREGKKGGKEE